MTRAPTHAPAHRTAGPGTAVFTGMPGPAARTEAVSPVRFAFRGSPRTVSRAVGRPTRSGAPRPRG